MGNQHEGDFSKENFSLAFYMDVLYNQRLISLQVIACGRFEFGLI
jgi:hypothetical protein